MKIGIASDHHGFKMKKTLIKYLQKKGYEVNDYGTDSLENVDYTKYAFKLGEKVRDKKVEMGIVICGTGIGVSIACNKVQGIRCAKVDNVKEARLTRTDNDSNVIALNGSMPIYRAKDILDVWLTTPFNKIERYERRIKDIAEYEKESRKDYE